MSLVENQVVVEVEVVVVVRGLYLGHADCVL